MLSPAFDTVSILAPHKLAEVILDEINEKLKMARTASFDASLVSAGALDSAVLEEVGRVTNTVVRLDPSGKKVRSLKLHHPMI